MVTRRALIASGFSTSDELPPMTGKGSLTEQQLGDGLSKAFPMPQGVGGPGRGPGGP